MEDDFNEAFMSWKRRYTLSRETEFNAQMVSFDSFDPDDSPGVGFELLYESDRFIIFCGEAGLFGCDLTEGRMTFALDFVKLYGKKGAVQGSFGTYAEASADGKTVALTFTDPDDPEAEQRAYYLDIPTLTCRELDAFRPLEDILQEEIFQKENAVGIVRPGDSYRSTVYLRGGKEWAVFEGFEGGK